MEWGRLISDIRLGSEHYHIDNTVYRTDFQKDYDRIIFSSPFRRMQNKTQVFPLPKNIFVHNRLTHSLEVSSVGRSLAGLVATKLKEKHGADAPIDMTEIASIVSAACLAHDMGNPPFGHSGETAISTFFSEGAGLPLKAKYNISDEQWADFTHFDGNANAFRLLTHQFEGRRAGGFVLTYSTLASIVKYPFPASLSPKKNKFGFFVDDRETYQTIAEKLGIHQNLDGTYARHPLVYLVEAADDICYEIMDIEDALKLRILDKDETFNLLLSFFTPEEIKKRQTHLARIDDRNEQIAYLRSIVIGKLIDACSDAFVDNEERILNGEKTSALIELIPENLRKAYTQCQKISAQKIYKSREVVDIEIAGYNIIYTLIEREMDAVFAEGKAYSKQLLARIPEQYAIYSPNPYQRILAILDYVSGMTDEYALDLYRKIMGINY